jgi:plasmid stabilization system protein ParE
MKVAFDDEVLDDLRRIFLWIATDNPRAAEKIVARIFAKAERLASPQLANMGRPGLDPGTRELIEYPTSLSTKSMRIAARSWCYPLYTVRRIARARMRR